MARRSSRQAQTVDLSYITPALQPLAVPISSLVHDPHNARLHPEDNASAIEGSFRRFGQRQVITFNPRLGNRVITGNERLRIARDVLGWAHIAAVAVEEDEQSAIGYALADNRAGELAGWNKDTLEQAMRLVEPSMNEQLDAMVIQLGREMNLLMPEMTLGPVAPPNGRPSRTETPTEATPDESGQVAMATPERATASQQRLLKLGGQEIPMTPEEERAIIHRLEQYQSEHGTTFGFVASLLETSGNAENGQDSGTAPSPVQPEAYRPGEPGQAETVTPGTGTGAARRGQSRRADTGRAPANRRSHGAGVGRSRGASRADNN